MMRWWPLLLICLSCYAQSQQVVYINSYHPGYQWSDKEQEAFQKFFQDSEVNVHYFYLNSKQLNQDQQIQQRANAIIKRIHKIQPDVIVAADDNASKWIIAPHFKNTDYPVVFLGINIDASKYGFPVDNVTGIVEHEGFERFLNVMEEFTGHNQVGALYTFTTSSSQKFRHFSARNLNGFDALQVKDFNQWKLAMLRFSTSKQLIAIDTVDGLPGYDFEQAAAFIKKNIRIPVISTSNSSKHLAHYGYIKVPEEHGLWAARSTQRILNGHSPKDIPIEHSSHYNLYINKTLVEASAVTVPPVFYNLPHISF